jgi:hypothetical protein
MAADRSGRHSLTTRRPTFRQRGHRLRIRWLIPPLGSSRRCYRYSSIKAFREVQGSLTHGTQARCDGLVGRRKGAQRKIEIPDLLVQQ